MLNWRAEQKNEHGKSVNKKTERPKNSKKSKKQNIFYRLQLKSETWDEIKNEFFVEQPNALLCWGAWPVGATLPCPFTHATNCRRHVSKNDKQNLLHTLWRKKKKQTPEEAQADKAKKGSRQQTKLPARVVIINKVIMRPSAGVGVAKSLPICHKLHLLLLPLPLLLPLLPVSYFTFCQAKFYY